MVQEIAQEIIRSARKKGAQDIYFVPKLDAYEASYEGRRRAL